MPPRRLDDIEFSSYDKLSVRLRFADPTNAPVDLQFSTITAEALKDNVALLQQPAAITDAARGTVTLNWTAEQVAQLPMYFIVVVRGARGSVLDPALTIDQLPDTLTWDEYPDDVLWDQPSAVGEQAWDDLDDSITWDDIDDETFRPTAFWDRSVISVRFTRNDAGIAGGLVTLDDIPVLVAVTEPMA